MCFLIWILVFKFVLFMNRLDRTKFWLRLAYFKPIFANDTSIKAQKFYSQTINLPKGNFPLKHGRDIELEIERKV